MLRHIALLKFSDDTPDEHIATFRDKMQALVPVIPEIISLEFGADELHTTRSWDVALVMSFADVQGLQTYLAHPDHVAIADFNKPYLVNIASVDYTIPA
ncbi:MAG: Dabb family protein [Chloroflexota bacterium]